MQSLHHPARTLVTGGRAKPPRITQMDACQPPCRQEARGGIPSAGSEAHEDIPARTPCRSDHALAATTGIASAPNHAPRPGQHRASACPGALSAHGGTGSGWRDDRASRSLLRMPSSPPLRAGRRPREIRCYPPLRKLRQLPGIGARRHPRAGGPPLGTGGRPSAPAASVRGRSRLISLRTAAVSRGSPPSSRHGWSRRPACASRGRRARSAHHGRAAGACRRASKKSINGYTWRFTAPAASTNSVHGEPSARYRPLLAPPAESRATESASSSRYLK